MNTIDSFFVPVLIGSKLVNAKVTVAWDDDQESIEGSFDFGNDKENREYMARFKSGELVSVYMLVTASWDRFEGVTSVGANHVIGGAGMESELYRMAKDDGMIQEAIAELQNDVARAITLLEPYMREKL